MNLTSFRKVAIRLYSSIALHSSRIKKLKRRVPLSDEAAATRAVNEGKCEFSAPVNLIQNAFFYSFHEAINAVQTTLSEELCGRVHSHESSSSSGKLLASRPEFISCVKAKFCYFYYFCYFLYRFL